MLLRYAAREQAEKAYAMTALRILVVRNGVDYPAYSDYVDSLNKPVKTDKRSSESVYNDIISQLRGESK